MRERLRRRDFRRSRWRSRERGLRSRSPGLRSVSRGIWDGGKARTRNRDDFLGNHDFQNEFTGRQPVRRISDGNLRARGSRSLRATEGENLRLQHDPRTREDNLQKKSPRFLAVRGLRSRSRGFRSLSKGIRMEEK